MKLFFCIAICATLLACLVRNNGAAGQESGPASDELTVIRQVACAKSTTLYELSNGLTLFVRTKPGSPTATVRVLVRNTGSMNEGEFLGSGISHLAEHLIATGGTSKRTKEETKDLINRMGGAMNAMTSKEFTEYYIDCSAESVSTAMSILADQMQNIVIDPKDFLSESLVVRQEAKDGQNNRGRAASQLLMSTLYREHPYRHPVIGYSDLLVKLTLDDVMKFYKARYTPNNQIWIVAGDVEPARILSEVKELYRGVPRGPEQIPVTVRESEQMSPRQAVREMDGATIAAYFAWPTVRLSDPDTYPLDVLANILAGGESSRFVVKYQRDAQVVLGINAVNMTPEAVPGSFIVQADLMPGDLAAFQTSLLDDIAQLATLPVGQDELLRAKKQMETAFIFSQQQIQTAADSVIHNYMLTGDPDYEETYLAGIRRVGAEDIRRVAKKYFAPERLSKIMIVPPGTTLDAAADQTGIVEEEIQAIRFPSRNIRVLLKRNTRDPIVNIQVFALGSSLLDSDANAGRSALLAELLDKGSAHYTRDELARYFDSIGSALTVRAGRNTIYANATVLKDDCAKTLNVLFDALLTPTLSQEEFDKAKTLLLKRVEQRKDNPIQELLEAFSDSLPTATPYHLQLGGTAESLTNLTLDELRTYHGQIFTPANLIVTVFGDIDPNQVAQQINNALSQLPDGAAAPEISFDRTNELIEPIREHRVTNKETAMGIIAWPTVSSRDEKIYSALTVLQAILGGYGYPGGRLFDELRSQGLVYRVQVDQMSGPVPGYLYVLFETQPEQLQTVVAEVLRIVATVANGDISEDEFQKAKDRIIAFHAMEKQTAEEQARQAALDDLYGLGFAYDQGFNERIQAVTLEEVIAAARQYLTENIIVTTGPEN
ncbi:MAG: pitrilysin family protein [Planctomycetia bacterium]|nr:pitrilysin family protein [Planctomycetia bacterium]